MKNRQYLLLLILGPLLTCPVLADSNFCGNCHDEIKQQYEDSIHGRARIKSGLIVAPTCVNCHDVRNSGPHTDPAIKNKTRTPVICGRCHTGILNEYKKSIHGRELLSNKNTDAPSCTDCHGVHTITEAFRTEAKVSPKNVPQTCAACHAVETLMIKYGIKTELVKTYRETFHGKANLFGQLTTANCSSCHGIHNIMKVDDPASQVSRKNLAKTCGKCHAAARNNPNFRNAIMHLKPSQAEEPLVFYVRLLYILLIVAVIGGMLIYNLFDLYKRLRERDK